MTPFAPHQSELEKVKAQHTPGPWHQDKYGHVISPDGSDVLFRSLTILSSSTAERISMAEANTRLIAAAPDLLEALQMAKHIVANEGTYEQMAQVFSAIEKATGEEA